MYNTSKDNNIYNYLLKSLTLKNQFKLSSILEMQDKFAEFIIAITFILSTNFNVNKVLAKITPRPLLKFLTKILVSYFVILFIFVTNISKICFRILFVVTHTS